MKQAAEIIGFRGCLLLILAGFLVGSLFDPED
jgi:hypothetical protein